MERQYTLYKVHTIMTDDRNICSSRVKKSKRDFANLVIISQKKIARLHGANFAATSSPPDLFKDKENKWNIMQGYNTTRKSYHNYSTTSLYMPLVLPHHIFLYHHHQPKLLLY